MRRRCKYTIWICYGLKRTMIKRIRDFRNSLYSVRVLKPNSKPQNLPPKKLISKLQNLSLCREVQTKIIYCHIECCSMYTSPPKNYLHLSKNLTKWCGSSRAWFAGHWMKCSTSKTTKMRKMNCKYYKTSLKNDVVKKEFLCTT